MTDSQRAAARDLFKEGDTLQRAGKLTEALDKFQRAQAVFDAPTNLLRIAECEAALGRLVESAEAFRAVLRAQLPSGSPPAFQAALDQANGELAQVEPRIPRLTVDVQPPKVAGLQLQIDGQSVSAALVGAPMPLDPGAHQVVVSAAGYTQAEQKVTLAERESKSVSLTLTAAPGGVSAGVSAGAGAGAGAGTVPPPPPVVESPSPAAPRGARASLLLGAHIGWEIPTGKVPIDPTTSTNASTSVDMKEVASSGPAIGLDGGIRFARQWVAGLVLEHAELGSGSHASLAATNATSNTTSIEALLGLIVNPDRPSFYAHLGLAARFFNVKLDGAPSPPTYTSGEAVVGAGVWIPSGRYFRILPEVTVNLGTFNPPNAPAGTDSSGAAQGHVLIMLGVAGYYSADL